MKREIFRVGKRQKKSDSSFPPADMTKTKKQGVQGPLKKKKLGYALRQESARGEWEGKGDEVYNPSTHFLRRWSIPL